MKKKRKTFDIRRWRQEKAEKHELWLQQWKVIRFHPITWLVICIALVYIHDAWAV
jgi:hypothetical protein